MRVYAVIEDENGTLELVEWTSIKAFESRHNWSDPVFVRVTTTAGLNTYSEPAPWGMIVLTPAQRGAHWLLHKKYLEMKK